MWDQQLFLVSTSILFHSQGLGVGLESRVVSGKFETEIFRLNDLEKQTDLRSDYSEISALQHYFSIVGRDVGIWWAPSEGGGKERVEVGGWTGG